MDQLTLLAGSPETSGGGDGGGGDAKRYHTVLDDASPVGFPINGDNDDDDQKWY